MGKEGLDEQTLMAIIKAMKAKQKLDELEGEGKALLDGLNEEQKSFLKHFLQFSKKEGKEFGKVIRKELGAWADTIFRGLMP